MPSVKNQFTSTFLKNLWMILNDERELNQICERPQWQDRSRERISFGLENWPDEEAKKLSIAVAEALHKTIHSLANGDENTLREIQNAHEFTKEILIPNLTQYGDLNAPLEGVKQQTRYCLDEIKQKGAYCNNPYVLFGGLAATAVALVWTLSSPSP
jgi:hypothetical protein